LAAGAVIALGGNAAIAAYTILGERKNSGNYELGPDDVIVFSRLEVDAQGAEES
jgi:hypothetical protein